MLLLSATIRTHSICCKRFYFSIFCHEFLWILFYWSLHFFRCSNQNWTDVQIFNWNFMEFWREVKSCLTYSYLYLLIQHLSFPQQHEITGFCWACNSLESPDLLCRNATYTVIFEPEFTHIDDACPLAPAELPSLFINPIVAAFQIIPDLSCLLTHRSI